MKQTESTFVFDRYSWEEKKGVLQFYYEVIHKGKHLHFTEIVTMPRPVLHVAEEVVAPFIQSLFLAMGISYWKAFCPEKIIIKPFSLTYEQATFWNTFYTKGLGEFFFRNKIDFRNLVQFPYVEGLQKKELSAFPRKDRSLLPVGGGKDAIVAAELLKKGQKEFVQLLVYTGTKETVAQEEVVKQIGTPVLKIERTIDPLLLELNKKKDVFNGHVPMVGLHSFISLFVACLYDFAHVITANEESANHGNVMYYGEIVNHQWSKSVEFEELLQTYVANFVSQDILYFSLLRGFTEIKIAQIFSQFSSYFSSFVSCNRGYAMHLKGKTHWCGVCPKCAFVFTLLAAYLPKEDVVGIFKKNLFADKNLLPLFRELLGIEAFKPFECVGTPQEMHLALLLAYEKGEWGEDALMQFFKKDILPTLPEKKILEEKLYRLTSHHVPESFEELIHV